MRHRTYSTDRPCPPRHRTHGIAALAATRIVDPGGEDGRPAAGGDEHGDAGQRHAKGSSSAVCQPIGAASDPNHVKEWSKLRAACLHQSVNLTALLPRIGEPPVLSNPVGRTDLRER
jgi:hypothetical protein